MSTTQDIFDVELFDFKGKLISFIEDVVFFDFGVRNPTTGEVTNSEYIVIRDVHNNLSFVSNLNVSRINVIRDSYKDSWYAEDESSVLNAYDEVSEVE